MTNSPLDIHCIAIGGTGMAPLACLLQEQGHRVRGSDGPLYPPMSTLLADAGIEPRVGFDPEHLEPLPDLIIVGNAVPRTNPQAVAVEEDLEVERISMPQALDRFFLSRSRPLVVAGTHGKTTTTSMASWVWTACGRNPGYLIGGLPKNLPASFHPLPPEDEVDAAQARFIIEGDEYNASYFDRGPKFLHYRPETLILTSAEYDHADLYPTPESLLDAYRQLVELVPAHGLVVAYGDSPEVRELCEASAAPTIFYGLNETDGVNGVRPVRPTTMGPQGSVFVLDDPEVGEVEIRLQVPGRHNVLNAMAVWVAARNDGLPAHDVVQALSQFTGVARRLEEVGTVGSVTVVDDFAHHPTAVTESLSALAKYYPDHRIVALFEPRSLSAARSLFTEGYREAFSLADHVLIAPAVHAERIEPIDRLDYEALARELRADGVDVRTEADLDQVFEGALRLARSESDRPMVIVTMSSGEFGRLPTRLVAGLSETAANR